MKILFIGSTRRGYLALDALRKNGADFAAIISLRQHKHELENFESQFSALAKRENIPLYESALLKELDYIKLIREDLKPDLTIVVGLRLLLPLEIINSPRLGTLAVHDSLLPKYRGFAPLNWSIINGEVKTGVTLFYLSSDMDAGDILMQSAVEIKENNTATEIYEWMCEETQRLIVKAFLQMTTGAGFNAKPQNHDEASYTCSRTPEDGLIDWSLSTTRIHNLIRGLSFPFPGARSRYQDSIITIWRAMPLVRQRNYVGRIPGRVVEISDAEGTVDVLTGDGILRVFELESEQTGKIPAAKLIRSVRATLGSNA